MTDFPKLPKEIGGLAGPLKVLRPVQLSNPRHAGEWDQLNRVIRVKTGMTREAAWHVLLHELAHAAVDEAGVGLPKKYEEPVAEAIASGMLQVVRHLLTP